MPAPTTTMLFRHRTKLAAVAGGRRAVSEIEDQQRAGGGGDDRAGGVGDDALGEADPRPGLDHRAGRGELPAAERAPP